MATNKIAVKIKDLKPKERYWFDDYSKSNGYFDRIIKNDDKTITVVFIPIDKGLYTVQKGLVRFKLVANTRDVFYKID